MASRGQISVSESNLSLAILPLEHIVVYLCRQNVNQARANAIKIHDVTASMGTSRSPVFSLYVFWLSKPPFMAQVAFAVFQEGD